MPRTYASAQDTSCATPLPLAKRRGPGLSAIEDEPNGLQAQLDSMNDADAQLAQLELQRDTLLDQVHNGFFEYATTTPEERHDLYKKMGLRVEVDGKGDVTISGSVVPHNEFVSAWHGLRPVSQNNKPLDLRFHARLTDEAP